MFLYFIAGRSTVTTEDLKLLGLDAVIDKPMAAKVMANGPGGNQGVILCDKSYGIVPQMSTTTQTWREAPKRGADKTPYWIGYVTENRPTPQTLAREKQVAGESMMMHDRTSWVVPKLVEWSCGADAAVYRVTVPQVLDIDDDGDLVPSRIDPAYEAVWNEGWRAHSALVGQAAETGKAVMMHQEAIQLACRLLGLNYRVSPLEVAVLGLFNDDLPIEVVKSAIDNTAFWDAVKNLAGRLGEQTTDSLSGVERPTLESHTDTRTDLVSAS